jgi:hypothetical protein
LITRTWCLQYNIHRHFMEDRHVHHWFYAAGTTAPGAAYSSSPSCILGPNATASNTRNFCCLFAGDGGSMAGCKCWLFHLNSAHCQVQHATRIGQKWHTCMTCTYHELTQQITHLAACRVYKYSSQASQFSQQRSTTCACHES